MEGGRGEEEGKRGGRRREEGEGRGRREKNEREGRRVTLYVCTFYYKNNSPSLRHVTTNLVYVSKAHTLPPLGNVARYGPALSKWQGFTLLAIDSSHAMQHLPFEGGRLKNIIQHSLPPLHSCGDSNMQRVHTIKVNPPHPLPPPHAPHQ